MPKLFIEESTLTDIGDAIRSKTGKTALIPPLDMPAEIISISGGGGGIPESALNLTGNCSHMFSNNKWEWFLREYGSQVQTSRIYDMTNMFSESSSIRTIPFTLNVDTLRSAEMFRSCTTITELPHININIDLFNSNSMNLNSLLQNCMFLSDAENLFDSEQIETVFSNINATGWNMFPNMQYLFYSCLRLRQVPSWWYKTKPSDESTYNVSNNYYLGIFESCYLLNELINIPIVTPNAATTTNSFFYTFDNARRLKNITFETNSGGTPYVVQWRNQTIDLTNNCGFNTGNLTQYGMSADKKVTDATTYQALKNDPDWWSDLIPYARYNHDSAVATINSLPDTSAYLEIYSGTNTIKFRGDVGESTDGGAIGTLTEEEIAVATAKGWTVTLV